MKIRPILSAAVGALAILTMFAGPAAAGSSNTVTWRGNGATLGSGGWTLNNVQCDENNTPYLKFVLAGSQATSATISFAPIPSGDPITNSMVKTNGTKNGNASFQHDYTTEGTTIDLDALLTNNTITASYNSTIKNPSLTISHGCLGAGTPPPTSSLTIVFSGEAYNQTGTWAFANLGFLGANNESITFCEKNNLTNCTTFAVGAIPSTSQTLTLSTSPNNLVVTRSNTSCNSRVMLFNNSVTVDSPANLQSSSSYTESAVYNVFPYTTYTTVNTFSNGNTIYWVHDSSCLS